MEVKLQSVQPHRNTPKCFDYRRDLLPLDKAIALTEAYTPSQAHALVTEVILASSAVGMGLVGPAARTEPPSLGTVESRACGGWGRGGGGASSGDRQ